MQNLSMSLRPSAGADLARLHERVLEVAHNGYVAIDDCGLITAWNPAAERIFGWSYAEAIGRELAGLVIPPAHRAAHHAGMARYLRTGAGRVLGRQLELSGMRSDGSEFPIEMTISTAEVGSRHTFHAFVADITERKHAEERLRETARRLAEAQTVAGLGSWEWNLSQQRLVWSDELCRIFGQPRGFSPTFGEFMALVHPEDRELLTGQVGVARAGELVENEYRVVRPDGEVRWLRARRYGRTDQGSGVTHLFGTNQDITELRAAQEAGRAAQELVETAFSDAPIGIALVALDGRWIKVNRILCEITGFSQDELLERTFPEITHPDDLASDLEYARQLREGAIGAYQMEKRYITSAGKVIWAHLSVSLVRDHAGQPQHFIAQIKDISQRKADELELRRERLALAEAQQIAQVGSWSWDTRADDATWSPEMYRILGRDIARGPATSEEFFAYLHPEDRDRVAAGYEHAFGAGETFELDYRIIRGDDQKLRALRGLGRRDIERPELYVGTVQDVTELREAERDALRQRDYVAAILTSMGEGFLLTRDGSILEVNDALCQLTGYARDELIAARVPYPFWAPEAIEQINEYRHAIAGATDARELETIYLRKDGTRVEVCITTLTASDQSGQPLGYVTTVRDISEQRRHQGELEHLATRDPLTGLLNHRIFHERLGQEVARSCRHARPLSVAVLDLDHFKHINDRNGHPVGDQVLREVAGRLETLLRAGEHLARVGGEEFAWLLPDTDRDGAHAAAERARHAISTNPFPHGGTLTISIGISELAGTTDPARLYEQADQALYAAKQQGRNRTVHFSMPEAP